MFILYSEKSIKIISDTNCRSLILYLFKRNQTMQTTYNSKKNKGLKNAHYMHSLFQGNCSDDVHFTLCPCLNKKAMLMSSSEITEEETQVFIRNLMDCDKLISTYVHNRLIRKEESSIYIFIGNYLSSFQHIYGILLLPS